VGVGQRVFIGEQYDRQAPRIVSMFGGLLAAVCHSNRQCLKNAHRIVLTLPGLAFRWQFPANLRKACRDLRGSVVPAPAWGRVLKSFDRDECSPVHFLSYLSKQFPDILPPSFSDSGDDNVRHPHLEEGTQSSTNEHLPVLFCFPITPAYTPVKKLGWT
jgi:hypothetical protein